MNDKPERTPLVIPWEEIPGGLAILEGKGLTKQQHNYMLLGIQMIAYYQSRDAASSGITGEEFTVLVLNGLNAVDKVLDKALKAKKGAGK